MTTLIMKNSHPFTSLPSEVITLILDSLFPAPPPPHICQKWRNASMEYGMFKVWWGHGQDMGEERQSEIEDQGDKTEETLKRESLDESDELEEWSSDEEFENDDIRSSSVWSFDRTRSVNIPAS